MNFDQESVLRLLCMIPAIVLGLTIHEFAHAWSADKLGDGTPRSQGRLTLDPIAHLDPIGSLFFLISSLVGFGLGWAKPVMTNPRNFAHPRRDSALVAVAGPISNLLQVPFWMLATFVVGFIGAKISGGGPSAGTMSMVDLVIQAISYGILVNIGLAAFNMIPIPPLDGHWILQAIGGRPIEELFDLIRPYSFILLIMLLNFTPLFRMALRPAYAFADVLADSALTAGVRLAIGA